MSDVTPSQLSNQHIFITGGAGFIGSSLIERLIDRNQVTVFDNFSRNALRFKDYRNHRNLQTITGDILDLHALKKSNERSQLHRSCCWNRRHRYCHSKSSENDACQYDWLRQRS